MNYKLNKFVQILITCFVFPVAVGTGFYNLFKPSDIVVDKVFVGEDNFAKTKTEPKSETNADCQLPFIKSIDTSIEYADDGDKWHRMLNIMPITDGSYMEITLNSPGSINFERYFANSSESFASKFCNTAQVAVSVYYGPHAKPGITIPFNKFYKIGTFTGNKMYFSIPLGQDVYVSTDNDIIGKDKIDLIVK